MAEPCSQDSISDRKIDQVPELHVTHHGRTARSIGVLVLVALGLIALLGLGLHWALVAVLSLLAIPALVDVVFDPVATFSVDDDGLHWKNATQEADITFHQIKSVHVATRLKVAFRITLIMFDDAKVQIPRDVLPPRADFEAALARHDILINHGRLRLT